MTSINIIMLGTHDLYKFIQITRKKNKMSDSDKSVHVEIRKGCQCVAVVRGQSWLNQ